MANAARAASSAGAAAAIVMPGARRSVTARRAGSMVASTIAPVMTTPAMVARTATTCSPAGANQPPPAPGVSGA